MKKKKKLDKLQDMVLYWKLRGQADKGTVFTQFNHKLYCNAIAIFMVRKKKSKFLTVACKISLLKFIWFV